MNDKSTRADVPPAVPQNLAAPIVTGLIDLGGGRFLVPADQNGQALRFEVPLWPNSDPTPEATERLQDFWNDLAGNWTEFTAPITPEHLRRHISQDKLEEGTHELWYQVTFQGEAPQGSPRLQITIDTTPPTLDDPSVLVFEPEVYDGVTRDYLAGNGDVLPATLHYAGATAHDVVKVYWDIDEGDNHEVLSYPVVAADVGAPITLAIPAAAIEASGDGLRRVRYRVFDRAGNASALADYEELPVKLEDEEEPGDGLLDPPAVYPEDVADETDGTLEGGIIEAGEGLRVLIPAWTNLPLPGETQTIQLNWAPGRDQESAEYELAGLLDVTGPCTPADFPKEMILPHDFLATEGPFLLRYQVVLWTGDPTDSAAITLISDGTSPWGTQQPSAPGVTAVPITDDYFATHPDGVAWTLPSYNGYQEGDTGVYWWVKSYPQDISTPPPTGTFVVPDTNPKTFVVPKAQVEAVGDGGCYLVYALIDKAGNASRLSSARPVTVALGPLPSGMRPPEFPQAVEDDVITLLDVHAGAIVAIPRFDNTKPTDLVRVTWGGITQQLDMIGHEPQWPLQIPVNAGLIQRAYGDAQGQVPTHVSYAVYRGGLIIEPFTGVVKVDISVAGPPLPNWPDPLNTDLTLGIAMGAVSQKPNTLDRRDAGRDATFTFPMYSPAGVSGEVVDVYWGETLAVTYPVRGTEAEDDPIAVRIPWEIIKDVGNHPTLPVHYRIRKLGSPNEQCSGMTLVAVDAVALVPPAPVFPHVHPGPTGEDALICRSLQGPNHAVHVQVPDLSQWLTAGDTVTLTWTPYDEKGEGELTGAIKVSSIELTADQLTGFIWEVEPYEKHLLPTYASPMNRAGWATCHYAFEFEGHPATSEPAEAEVHMYDADGSCPLD